MGWFVFFFFSSRRRHTRCYRDWSSDVCSSDLSADRAAKHPFRGRTWSFEELVQHRLNERFDSQITLDTMRTRHAACQQALDRLAETFAEVKPDVAVIFGNDQMEIFNESLIPAFGVMWGPRIVNAEMTPDHRAKLPPGVAEAIAGHIPP